MKLNFLPFALALLSGAANAQLDGHSVGDTVCVVGYVMDTFCIDRGTQLDNGKSTLGEPEAHSVHCLIDVSFCANSPFNILQKDGNAYKTGYYMTDNSMLIESAKTLGSCTECTGDGDIATGLRLQVTGVVEADVDGRAQLKPTAVELGGPADVCTGAPVDSPPAAVDTRELQDDGAADDNADDTGADTPADDTAADPPADEPVPGEDGDSDRVALWVVDDDGTEWCPNDSDCEKVVATPCDKMMKSDPTSFYYLTTRRSNYISSYRELCEGYVSPEGGKNGCLSHGGILEAGTPISMDKCQNNGKTSFDMTHAGKIVARDSNAEDVSTWLCLGVAAEVVDGTRAIELMDCEDAALTTWKGYAQEAQLAAGANKANKVIDDGRVHPFREEPEVTEPDPGMTDPDPGMTDPDPNMDYPMDYPDTVVDVVMSDGNYSTLLSLISDAGLKDALMNETQNFTLFAPTNEAFMAAENDTLRYTMEGYETHMADILSYHAVVGEKVLSTDMSNNQVLTMGNGEDATITTRRGLKINGVLVTGTDMMADNGVVHEIDTVLFPSWTETDIVALASQDEMQDIFSSLVENVVKANLTGPLMGEGPFTVFAPTNEAFAAAADALAKATMGEEEEMDMDALTEILLYHVHAGAVFSDSVEDGVMLEMMSGDSVTFSVMEVMDNSTEAVDNSTGTAVSKAVAPTYVPMVDGAKIIATDILANNGVVHIIDAVLLPKDMMMDGGEM